MLKTKFIILAQKHCSNLKIIEQLWQEIKTAHTEEHRAYHTLRHLENFYKELQEFQLCDVIQFAIFYHDIVYNVIQHDNEEQSAVVAQKALEKLKIQEITIKEVIKLILETKNHKPSSKVNALFLDADIAILGAKSKIYQKYTYKIRQEYNIFTDASYNKGRIEMLESFLKKEEIYKSAYFYEKYEKQAKENLEREKVNLSKLLN